VIPLDREFTPQEVNELIALIRRATRPATAALARIASDGPGKDASAIYEEAQLETIAPDLYRSSGSEPSSPPIYLSHSEADRDAAIIRPLGWRDPAGDGESLRNLLFSIPQIPSGGLALARLGQRDLVLFLDHLATQQLDLTEVQTSLHSARSAGVLHGVDTVEESIQAPVRASGVVDSIDRFLLQRPTGWSRPQREAESAAGWVRAEGAPMAAYFDRDRGLLVLARTLQTFLGNPPLDTTERLLRMNLGLLHGAIAGLRDGARSALVLLERLCCLDLDPIELERSVSYVERV
jgi:hypothetical protein